MAQVEIKLVNEQFLGEFYFRKDQVATARSLFKDGWYRAPVSLNLWDLEGEAAAEECFDLTNNPSRQEEREAVYGRSRSVSVGDIVAVDGVDWLCCSEGWQRIQIG